MAADIGNTFKHLHILVGLLLPSLLPIFCHLRFFSSFVPFHSFHTICSVFTDSYKQISIAWMLYEYFLKYDKFVFDDGFFHCLTVFYCLLTFQHRHHHHFTCMCDAFGNILSNVVKSVRTLHHIRTKPIHRNHKKMMKLFYGVSRISRYLIYYGKSKCCTRATQT